MTVTTVLLTVMSSARASSAVPWKAKRCSGEPGDTVTWDIAKPTASAASPATPGSTHNAPLTYSLSAYQATDSRTRRTKPSELELGFMYQAIAGEPGRSCMAFGVSRRPRLDNYRLRRTVSIDDMVNIHRTPMRACTALNNSLYLAGPGGRVMRKVRSVPALLITVAGYRLLRPAAPSSASIESTKPAPTAEEGGGSAYTFPDSMNARCASHALPRPPWHGTRKGFESPKLHGKSASQSIFDLERHKIALCDREHPGLMDAVRPRSAATSHRCWGRAVSAGVDDSRCSRRPRPLWPLRSRTVPREPGGLRLRRRGLSREGQTEGLPG